MSDTTTAPPTAPPPPPRSDHDARIRLTAVLVGIAAALVLAAGAVAVLAGGSDDADPNEGWHGELQDPTPRPEFTLTDTEGRPYDFAAETQGQLTLLFFGYTHCPDICPAHLSILTAALDMPGVPQPKVVFVTTDPARDTPERLREWLGDNFDDDYIGLTGTVEEVAAAEAAAFVGGSFRLDDEGRPLAVEPDPASDYEVGHAAQILAYTPDDQAHIAYPFGVRSQDWADDLPRLLEEFPAGTTGDAPEGQEDGS